MDTSIKLVKKYKKRKRNNSYAISDKILLYKISDAGLLCYLHGIHKSKTDPENRVYYFERNPDIREIIVEYQKIKHEYKNV